MGNKGIYISFDISAMQDVENYGPSYPEGSLSYGSFRCCGDGLVAATIYCNGHNVGTRYANNGMCGYEAGNIGDVIRIPYEEVKEPLWLVCPRCGSKLTQIDMRYEDENPNACSYWYYQLVAGCDCNRCPDCGQFDCCCNDEDYIDFMVGEYLEQQVLQPITLESVAVLKYFKNEKRRDKKNGIKKLGPVF